MLLMITKIIVIKTDNLFSKVIYFNHRKTYSFHLKKRVLFVTKSASGIIMIFSVVMLPVVFGHVFVYLLFHTNNNIVLRF